MPCVRLYLDACCLNRPFDDQTQMRVHLESAAILAIIERVEKGLWTMVSSSALDFELGRIPDAQRRARVQRLISAAQERAIVGPVETTRAEHLRAAYGFRALDALHLACAEGGQADIFLTTDDALLRAARRILEGELKVPAANPLTWLTNLLAHE